MIIHGAPGLLVKKLNIVVIPYRDRYFLERYGNAVRDLHIIQALSRSPEVASVSVLNRPVTIHERILGMKALRVGEREHPDFPSVKWINLPDYALLGPLRKRRWLEHCYDRYMRTISSLKKDGQCNILLDFSPISKIDYASLGYSAVWYDAIDNFAKHNRFSDDERRLVREKYASVTETADIVTAVSEGATKPMKGATNLVVLPNGLPAEGKERAPLVATGAQDFGFMGFVTDKFDVDLVERLSRRKYTVAVHGDIYDKAVAERLRCIPGVKLYGAFNHKDLDGVSATFKVGLIPYLKTKLHDESPLKLYQYLSRGKTVLTSVAYEISNEYVQVYDGLSDDELYVQADTLIDQASSEEKRQLVTGSISEDVHWDSKIDRFLIGMKDALKLP